MAMPLKIAEERESEKYFSHPPHDEGGDNMTIDNKRLMQKTELYK